MVGRRDGRKHQRRDHLDQGGWQRGDVPIRRGEEMKTVLIAGLLAVLSSAAFAEVKIGAGGELIIGGFDPGKPADADTLTKQLDDILPKLKALGMTSHEGYVRWNLCEP